jgi:hypothetical protein
VCEESACDLPAKSSRPDFEVPRLTTGSRGTIAETEATTHANDLHRVPFLSADVSPGQLLGRRSCREMHCPFDGWSSSLRALGGRTLLGRGNALVITERLAIGLGGRANYTEGKRTKRADIQAWARRT